jgi:hypothetical protein
MDLKSNAFVHPNSQKSTYHDIEETKGCGNPNNQMELGVFDNDQLAAWFLC